MKGITVILYTKTESGRDAFNTPVFDEIPVQVDNVLVSPSSNVEIAETLDLTGKRLVYDLAIPKGDSHDWENCKVSFFGEDWRVINFVAGGIEELVPLSWNAKVQVARYE